jgi:hemicentin
MTYSQGDNASLECTSEGGPNNTYQWLVNGSELDEETSQTLILSNIAVNHGATYTCMVTNIAGNDSASTFVSIHPYVVTNPFNQSVAIGSSVVFICDLVAFPNPEYMWLRTDGRIFRDSITVNGRNLSIASIEYGDEGGYYCNASVGELSAESEVAVLSGMK